MILKLGLSSIFSTFTWLKPKGYCTPASVVGLLYSALMKTKLQPQQLLIVESIETALKRRPTKKIWLIMSHNNETNSVTMGKSLGFRLFSFPEDYADFLASFVFLSSNHNNSSLAIVSAISPKRSTRSCRRIACNNKVKKLTQLLDFFYLHCFILALIKD